MVSFKSVAVLDLETTSLPENDHNTTKIIELAILGCEIDHVKHSKESPRVLHKLILLFNPKKTVSPEATRTSGLSNELLMNIKAFTEDDAEALKYFLSRLPQPVCIIAHNGDKFDFPILRRALKKVNKILPQNIYCADSMKAFKQLLPRSWNETTPPNQRTQPDSILPNKTVARKLFQNDSPVDLSLDDQKDFPNNPEFSDWASSQDRVVSFTGALSCPKSYSLKDIYYHFFRGYFLDAHRAEEDSKALLSCIIQCDGFWEWISKNCVIFNSIAPLF